MASALSKNEIERYARHFVLPGFGKAGQEKLKSGSAIVIGAGGLGVPVLQYLAAAGIGTLGIVDQDVIEISNLQRQVFYTQTAAGLPKVYEAAKKIADLNPNVKIHTHSETISSNNALEILQYYDVIIDGTDNFPTRYLLNDAAVLLGKPLVYGSIHQFEGQVSVFNYGKGENKSPNYRDLYPEPPAPDTVPNCAEGGVLGVIPGIIGSMQANEALKVLTGYGEPLAGQLLLYDALSGRTRIMKYGARKDRPNISRLIDYEAFCGIKKLTEVPEITVHELNAFKENNRLINLIDVREPHEFELVNIGGTLAPASTPEKIDALIKPDAVNVLHCRSGQRSSQQVARLITMHAQVDIRNLSGGILAWIEQIDPSLPRY